VVEEAIAYFPLLFTASMLFDVCPLRDTFFHPTEVAPGDPLILHWIVTDVTPKIGEDWVGVTITDSNPEKYIRHNYCI
jgi:hypothetical protein